MKSLNDFELEASNAFNESTYLEEYVEKLIELKSKNNPYAIYFLGSLYEAGNGVEQSDFEALSHYKTASDMGVVDAIYQLGVTAEFGRCGVEKSYKDAEKFYKEAADLGHSDAQCQLGGIYERGIGVEKNYKLSFHFYKLSADNGNARAKFLLADSYLNGKLTSKSITEALNLYHQAAELGHGFSQLILAARYKYGDELPRDYVKAYNFANLAVNSAGNQSDKEAALSLRDEIYSLMSNDDKKALFQ